MCKVDLRVADSRNPCYTGVSTRYRWDLKSLVPQAATEILDILGFLNWGRRVLNQWDIARVVSRCGHAVRGRP